MAKGSVSHRGRIVGMDPQWTTVQFEAQSACSSCHAAGLCGMSEMTEKTVQVAPDPYASYQVGDEVEVVLKASMGIKAVWIAYMVPLLALLAVFFGASALGAEYSVVFHEDGTLDFTMAGTAVPGLLWKADGDALTIDYYGAGEIRVTADDEGIAFDMFGTMTLKMVP